MTNYFPIQANEATLTPSTKAAVLTRHETAVCFSFTSGFCLFAFNVCVSERERGGGERDRDRGERELYKGQQVVLTSDPSLKPGRMVFKALLSSPIDRHPHHILLAEPTPSQIPHPIVQDTKSYLMTILGVETAPFAYYGLSHTANSLQLPSSLRQAPAPSWKGEGPRASFDLYLSGTLSVLKMGHMDLFLTT